MAEGIPELATRAVAELEVLAATGPDSPNLQLVLGFFAADRYRASGSEKAFQEASELYLRAIEGFRRRGNRRGEIWSRESRWRLLRAEGRLKEAAEEVRFAAELAEDSSDPLAQLDARLLGTIHARALHSGLGRAYEGLRAAYKRVPEVSTIGNDEDLQRLHRRALHAIGNLAIDLGLLKEALAYYERLAELSRAEGSVPNRVRALHAIALAKVLLADLGEEKATEVIEAFRRVVEVAGEFEHHTVVFSHCELALLLEGREQETHLRRCRELGEKVGSTTTSVSFLTKARVEAEEDPMAALDALEGALRALDENPEPFRILLGWNAYLRLAWKTLGPREALEASLAVLDAVELVWSAQQGDAPEVEHATAALLSSWSEAFYWLAGRLFREVAESDARWALEEAFRVSERMRGRLLLDDLRRAEVRQSREGGGMASVAEISSDDVFDEIRRLRATLLAWAASKGEDPPTRSAPSRQPLDSLPLAELEEVRGLLAEDEALLAFQMINALDVYGHDTGGSWAVVVTQTETAVLSLPSAKELRGPIRLWRRELAAAEGSPEKAVWLFGKLLAEPLAALPEGIEHLILVPDGELHGLPFAALRASAEAPPLGTRYRISVVPSATLWQRWRRSGGAPGSAALAFADPQPLPFSDGQGKKLRPLPEARREARRVARRTGGASLAALGEEATETRLKSLDLGPYSVVHFATHTVINHQAPYRSAVILAPDDGRSDGGSRRVHEDGLLEPAEIADLELQGRLVVLAACSSATGEVLRGEGVMGLARAFFAAGATTVLGTHWEVEDRASERFFHAFYEHLAAGQATSEALRRAQEERWRAGDPTGAWAGYVVLGEGEDRPLRPRTGGVISAALRWWPAALILVLFITFAIFLAHRRRRTP